MSPQRFYTYKQQNSSYSRLHTAKTNLSIERQSHKESIEQTKDNKQQDYFQENIKKKYQKSNSPTNKLFPIKQQQLQRAGTTAENKIIKDYVFVKKRISLKNQELLQYLQTQYSSNLTLQTEEEPSPLLIKPISYSTANYSKQQYSQKDMHKISLSQRQSTWHQKQYPQQQIIQCGGSQESIQENVQSFKLGENLQQKRLSQMSNDSNQQLQNLQLHQQISDDMKTSDLPCIEEIDQIFESGIKPEEDYSSSNEMFDKDEQPMQLGLKTINLGLSEIIPSCQIDENHNDQANFNKISKNYQIQQFSQPQILIQEMKSPLKQSDVIKIIQNESIQSPYASQNTIFEDIDLNKIGVQNQQSKMSIQSPKRMNFLEKIKGQKIEIKSMRKSGKIFSSKDYGSIREPLSSIPKQSMKLLSEDSLEKSPQTHQNSPTLPPDIRNQVRSNQKSQDKLTRNKNLRFELKTTQDLLKFNHQQNENKLKLRFAGLKSAKNSTHKLVQPRISDPNLPYYLTSPTYASSLANDAVNNPLPISENQGSLKSIELEQLLHKKQILPSQKSKRKTMFGSSGKISLIKEASSPPPISKCIDTIDFDEYQQKPEHKFSYTEDMIKNLKGKYKLNLKIIKEQRKKISEFNAKNSISNLNSDHLNTLSLRYQPIQDQYSNTQNIYEQNQSNINNDSQEIKQLIQQTYDEFFGQNQIQEFIDSQVIKPALQQTSVVFGIGSLQQKNQNLVNHANRALESSYIQRFKLKTQRSLGQIPLKINTNSKPIQLAQIDSQIPSQSLQLFNSPSSISQSKHQREFIHQQQQLYLSKSHKNFIELNKDVKLRIAQKKAEKMRKALDEDKGVWEAYL